MRKFLALTVLVLALGSLAVPTLAQDQSTVIPQQIDPQKQAGLQKQYLALLEQYRTQELRYSVAKNQYLQLNTLASQEEAIKETRELLVVRAEIFSVYLELLDQILNDTRGIPLENKNAEKVALSLLKEQVRLHKTRLASSLDRTSLDTESAAFKPRLEEIESHAYYTFSMVKLGTMQTAIDKLVVVRNAVKEEITNRGLGAAAQSEKERGFAEIDRTINSAGVSFQPIKLSVYSAAGTGSLSSYTQLNSKLSTTYAQINQATNFLEEIRK